MKLKLLIIAILSALLFSANQSFASERPLIRVSAEGIAKALPDQAEIQLSFQATATEAEAARKIVENRLTPFLKALEDYQLESQSLDTSQINVYPQYDYYKDKRELRGFQVSRQVTFKLNQLSELEDLIKLITRSKANNIQRIQFQHSHASLLKEEALSNAIRNATKTATHIAEGFNVELKGIHTVNHQSGGYSQPPIMRARAMSAEMASDSSSSYEQKAIEYKALIEVEFNFD